MKFYSKFNTGNVLLVVLTLLGLVAIVGITAYSSLQKTHLINKAATSCGIHNFDVRGCLETVGCTTRSTTCANVYSTTNQCPTNNCNLTSIPQS